MVQHMVYIIWVQLMSQNHHVKVVFMFILWAVPSLVASGTGLHLHYSNPRIISLLSAPNMWSGTMTSWSHVGSAWWARTLKTFKRSLTTREGVGAKSEGKTQQQDQSEVLGDEFRVVFQLENLAALAVGANLAKNVCYLVKLDRSAPHAWLLVCETCRFLDCRVRDHRHTSAGINM